MSTLSPVARSLPASLLANQQKDAKSAATDAVRQLGGIASNPVSLSTDGLDMQKRVASVGNATVDYAQNLLGSFAEKLFGGAGKDATISFDSASLEAESGYSLAVQHSTGPGGTSDAAALQLSDSAHFIGKGSITTSDGRKFDFEVEIQYSYDLRAGVSQTQGPAQDADADAGGVDGDGSGSGGGKNLLPTRQMPDIDFPGTLSDLFKLIGVDLQAALSGGASQDQSAGGSGATGNDALGQLSLRLLNLVDSKDDSTYAPQAAADKTKSVASAYGVSNASSTNLTTAQVTADQTGASGPSPSTTAAANTVNPADGAAVTDSTGDNAGDNAGATPGQAPAA